MDSRPIRTAVPFLLIALLPAGAIQAEPTIAGWVERVRILEAGIEVDAKLDSGAEHSSLNAADLVRFEREGRPWVRFRLRNRAGQIANIERPVVRTARIKRHSSESQRRPVIELTLCLGRLARTVEVNLVDRSRFDYQLLVGRSFLSHGILVDSASTGRQEPMCEHGARE